MLLDPAPLEEICPAAGGLRWHVRRSGAGQPDRPLVLLLHGTADRVFPTVNARTLAQTAKHATLHLENCGHADCPPQWERVLGFLRANGV